MIRLFFCLFRISPMTSGKTNGRVAFRIDHPVATDLYLCVTDNAEETSNYLFRYASCSNNFCWIRAVLENPCN
ncbi:hypothetical protein TNCT_100521 [Trichonephila clavata]|uniref:Secreted protein n=1 Tax=Trichonephila clavata TaxID=2740835 RepID=A0A8X6HVP0_TRICU|nr:hypothetical protein TNCT_100521 [Trichonephila clavata]